MAKYHKLVFSLASLVVVFCLLAPSVSYALLTDDWTGIMTSALEATNDITAPLLSVQSEVLKIYVASIVCLGASTAILQWEITNPQWLNLKGTMVTYGWNLTKGLANMFLLLIFVVIAFGFILKIDSLQSSKSLPRLIIVALLINFSKLFVGMIVDISTIATNTIIYGHENLLVTVMTGFLNGMYALMSQLILSIISNFTQAAIPLGNLFKIIFMMASLASKGIFIASAPVWIFQIVAASALTSIFCLYIFLFAARVYIVQILAILSPLAFLCLILPQTQKYWDEWLKHLVQWSFVGAVLLFFLMLGLSAGNQILPNASLLPHAFDLGSYFPILNIPKYYLFYSFLFIYLAVSFWLTDRTMPMIAVAIIGMAKSAATQGWNKFGKNATGNLVKGTNEKAAEYKAKDKAARDEQGNLTLQGVERWKHIATGKMLTPVAAAHRLQRTTPEMSVAAYQNEEKEKFEKKYGKSEDGAENAMKAVFADKKIWKNMGSAQKLGFARYGIEQKGGDFIKEMEKPENRGMLDDMLGQAVIHNKGLVKETIGHAPHKLDGSPFGMQLRRTVLEGTSGQREMERMRDIHGPNATRDEIERKAALSIGMQKILGKEDRIKTLSDETLANSDAQEAIALNARPSDIGHLGRYKGQNTLDSLNTKVNDIGLKKMVRGNAPLVRAMASNPSVQEILPGSNELTRLKDKGAKLNFINRTYKTEKDEVVRERRTRTVNEAPAGIRRPGETAGQRFGGEAGAAPGQGGGAAPPTFTPGAAGQRGARADSREIGENREAPRTPGTGERRVPISPDRIEARPGTSRSGRTGNVYPDDLGDAGRANPRQRSEPDTATTPPSVNRTRRAGQSNLGDFGRARDTSPQEPLGDDLPPGGGTTESGRTDNVHPDDLNP